MISKFVAFIKNPFRGILFLVIIFLIVPFYVGNFLGNTINNKIEIFLITFIIIIFFAELVFRFFYRLYFGTKYNFTKKIPFDKIRVEPHPYLPYILKKKLPYVPSEKMNYPLNPNFYSAEVKTNNFRFVNGPQGDRDIIVPKPKNLYRINCIGGSTTQNYLNIDKVDNLLNLYKDKSSNLVQRNTRYDLGSNRGYWFILAIFLILEWYLRKNKGLI